MRDEAVFDVSAFINRQGIGRTQLLVLGLCALAMAVDGYDVYVVGFVLPAIAKNLGVTPAAMTPVLLAQQVGLAIGSYLVSPIADRFGRKLVMMTCMGIFGVFTLAATQAHTVTELAVLRFLGGLFFSGVIPNCIALTSEVAPERARSTLVTIMFCGYTFGTAAGGYAATLILGALGWQGAFWAGGIVPLVLLPIFWLALPESLQFRVQRNDRDPRIAELLRQIDPHVPLTGAERFLVHEKKIGGAPVALLFRDGRATATLLLWFSFFMSLLAINLVSGWSSTFFVTFGAMTLQQAARNGVVVAVAGIGSMIFYGAVLDRFGPSRVLTITYVLGAAAVASLGFIDWHSGAFYIVLLLEGACVIGAQSGLNALSAVIYPTEMRATGVGWAFGAGRIGSMLGPLLGGYMLQQHWGVTPVFLTCAVPILCVAIGTLLVSFDRPEAQIAPAE